MILGYLDINTKNIDVERQRQQILQYTAANNLAVDMFVQESSVYAVASNLETENLMQSKLYLFKTEPDTTFAMPLMQQSLKQNWVGKLMKLLIPV